MNPESTKIEPSTLFGGVSTDQLMAMSIMESCAAKTVLSGGAGFVLGGMFGMFMSSVDWNVNMDEYLKMSTKQQFKHTLRDMGAKSLSTAKNFGTVGAMFSGTECLIETYRAKNDIYNGVAAGCSTGGILAAKGGPKAVLVGCAGFAAFSAAIDTWIRHSD